MTNKNHNNIYLKLEKDLYYKLSHIAKEEMRTRPKEIIHIIENYISIFENNNGTIVTINDDK